MTITMFDSTDISQIPASAQAVAGYVNGKWQTYPHLVAAFPHAHVLSIAVSASADADCLDIETGDATPAQAAAWYARQKARGVARPCLYASAFIMDTEVIPAITRAGISRAGVRLWSAHYTRAAHICGPSSCRELGIAADGTQWTNRAMGRNLDQSLLADDFFVTPPAPKPAPKGWTAKMIADLPELSEGADDAHLPHWYVHRAQLIANGVFHASPQLAVDGKFGAATVNALRVIQCDYKLPVTGKLDAATWGLLLAGVKP